MILLIVFTLWHPLGFLSKFFQVNHVWFPELFLSIQNRHMLEMKNQDSSLQALQSSQQAAITCVPSSPLKYISEIEQEAGHIELKVIKSRRMDFLFTRVSSLSGTDVIVMRKLGRIHRKPKKYIAINMAKVTFCTLS